MIISVEQTRPTFAPLAKEIDKKQQHRENGLTLSVRCTIYVFAKIQKQDFNGFDASKPIYRASQTSFLWINSKMITCKQTDI